jgi:hypothetical protein
LDFDFFNVGRSSESLTQSLLGQKKHFFVKKNWFRHFLRFYWNRKLKKDRQFNGMLKNKRQYNCQRKKDKQWTPKYYTENLRLRNTNQTKIRKFSIHCATHSYWFDGCRLHFFWVLKIYPHQIFKSRLSFHRGIHKKVNRYYIDHTSCTCYKVQLNVLV